MKNNNIRPTGLKGNEQVNRMRKLMGMAPVNESTSRSVVELNKLGPDGRIYGIVRENHEYYIKIANNKPNLVVEDFQYIGGLKNKKDVVYESYAKAIKHLNLKFISLNEAKGIKGETDTFTNDNLLNESFESYNEAPKPSQPDSLMGTVKAPGKNDGHETEIINDSGETGNPDVDTPPVVEEEDVVEGEETIDENEVELTESEKAIDKMIMESRVSETAEEVTEEVVEEVVEEDVNAFGLGGSDEDHLDGEDAIKENKLRIATAHQKIAEGSISSKKKK